MRALSSFVMMAIGLLVFVDPALAQGEAAGGLAAGMAGVGIGIAAFGGAMGQSRSISAALESIGRNPGAAGQMFLPWLLALVLIESLVIYAFVIALKLVGLI